MEDALIANAITLLAGFGGAVLGSAVSGWITWRQARAAKKEMQKSEVFKLMIKASLIQSDFVNLKSEIENSISTADQNGLKAMPIWAKIQPNPDDFEKIAIEPQDLVCLFEAREFDLLSDVVELGMKHGRVVGAFNAYSSLRKELKDHMPLDDVKGSVVGSNLTEADLRRLQPRFLELSSLLDSIIKLLPRYVQESESVNNRLGPTARKYFADPNFPLISSTSSSQPKP